MKANVYRSGVVAPPASRGVELESYRAADAVRPAGRQGRETAFFAAPSIAGVLRWVRAHCMLNIRDPFVRELTVDPETVYVYCINTWEKCSSWNKNYEEYWATGMTLADWLRRADEFNHTEWELLLNSGDVIAQKPVSDRRLVQVSKTCDSLYDDVKNLLKMSRFAEKYSTV